MNRINQITVRKKLTTQYIPYSRQLLVGIEIEIEGEFKKTHNSLDKQLWQMLLFLSFDYSELIKNVCYSTPQKYYNCI